MSRASGGIGRRARFRSVCPKGRGGSTPPSRTKKAQVRLLSRRRPVAAVRLRRCNDQVTELPTGTVTLLFSDIEGSTALLTRLGADYADALDGQRKVLRRAWADYGGTELGTEGDSFFVVFTTAVDAVAAATAAQRKLATYPWPAGEQVRVRMGIHTGSPTVHDDGYVGMDVHRAARIAGAAHGGQVVISSTTAELVSHRLPEQVSFRDLGSQQLKDIPQPEHVFQLAIEGLQAEFPALKTLGAATSLPRPATALVGRDGELAELTALLSSPALRLLTLTGPGGSGKTRLAIALAHRLVERYPDGVYFVSLAAATTSDIMWTSIAEMLDVPSEARTPPGFFEHVAHRSALFILDNLEQIDGADNVVAELLDSAPQMTVIATTRRPLHVPAEHEHPVPPLELPHDNTPAQVAASGAVQLFVQHARKVRPAFQLIPDNAADVAEVCRRLDGLPLAIELAAARSKLLSPAALVTRLDRALDLAATGRQGPSRQKTLRDTIAWSYDLLNPNQKTFFRRLGVFSGGADLDAVTAVASFDRDDGIDALDVVADLVDASLITVAETADGEPRVGMLETVRAYAVDQLTAAGELQNVQERHAHHYLQLAEELTPQLFLEGFRAARSRFEIENDNLRESLEWALKPPVETSSEDWVAVAPRLCRAMAEFWLRSGYFSEGRRWLERTIDAGGTGDKPQLAECLSWVSLFCRALGDLNYAHSYATESVAMARRLGDVSLLPSSLKRLAVLETYRGQPDAARSLYKEALTLARESGDKTSLMRVLGDVAIFEGSQHNLLQALELDTEALSLARQLGNAYEALQSQHNMACTLREMGRADEAKQQMCDLIPAILELNDAAQLIAMAEDYAAVLAELGDHHQAVQLLGAADAMHQRLGVPRDTRQEAEIAEPIAKTRVALTSHEWEDTYQTGRHTTVEDALTQVHVRHAPN